LAKPLPKREGYPNYNKIFARLIFDENLADKTWDSLFAELADEASAEHQLEKTCLLNVDEL
jgi:hypothetical protein